MSILTAHKIALGLGSLVAAGTVPADPPAVDSPDSRAIEEIVVVAHKSERRLREVAAHVTILTRDDFRDELSADLGDSFRYTPGVEAERSGARFGTEGINIRGVGGNRVALLLDGVPLGEHFAIGSYANATRDFLEAGFLQRAEVLHGPASALYGSDAIGGVLAAQTVAPGDIAGRDGRGASLTGTWRGADGSMHGTALGALGGDALGALVGVSVREGDEAKPAPLEDAFDRRQYRRRAALLKFAAEDGRGHGWRGGILGQESAATSDLRSMLGAGRFVSTTSLEGDDRSRLQAAHLEFGFGEDDALVETGHVRAWYARSDIDQRTLEVRGNAARPVSIQRRFDYEQRARGLEVHLQKAIDGDAVAHRLGAGFEVRKTRTDEMRDGRETGIADGRVSATILGEEFPLRDFPVSDTVKWGAWLEDTMAFGRWHVAAAVRADRYELSPRPDAVFAADNPAAVPVSLTETDVSPKLGITHEVTEALNVYLQYAHGFRAPPFEDANIGLDVPLLNIRALPNPDLRSERSHGFDVGLRWAGDAASFRLGVFQTRYRDFIESKAPLGLDAASGRLLFQSRNVANARIEGIEGSWRAALPGALENLHVDGAFHLARSENRDDGQPLDSVGPAQAVLGLAWQPSERRHYRVVATLTDRWSARDETRGDSFKPPGHALIDLLATHALGERATLRAAIMNATDRTWWHWSAVRALAPEDPVLPAVAQPGRSYVLQLEWHWQ